MRELDRAKQLGYWFSIGPAMLATKKGADIVCLLPQTNVKTLEPIGLAPTTRIAGGIFNQYLLSTIAIANDDVVTEGRTGQS
jgi:hypothetical protein